jgi:hypothetical protein
VSENRGPFGAVDAVLNGFNSTSIVQGCEVQACRELDVLIQFLVGLVVTVVERAAFVLDNAGEAVHVCDGRGSG